MKKGILAGLGGYIVLLLTTIQTIIVTRQLGPLDIGNYTYFRQWSLLGAQLITLGIPSGLIYFINAKQFSLTQLLSTNIKIHILLSCIYLGGLILFKDQVLALFNDSFHPSLMLAFGYAMFIGIRNYFYNALLSRLQVKKTVLLDILPVVLSFSCVMFLVITNAITVYKVLFFDLFVIPFMGTCIGILSIFKRAGGIVTERVSPRLFLSQAARGFWFNLSDMLLLLQAYLLYYLVNKYISQPEEIGYYSRAFSIINLFVTSLVFITRYFYASWSKADLAKKTGAFTSVVLLGFASSAIFSVLIFIFAHSIVTLLFGAEFVRSAEYLQILVVCIPMNIIFLLVASFNNSEGNVRYNVYALFLSVILFVVLVQLHVTGTGSGSIALAFMYATVFLGIGSLAALHLNYKIPLSAYARQANALAAKIRNYN